MSDTKEAVTALLADYNKALGESDADAVAALYAEDGVVMPPFTPTAAGREAVRLTYGGIFKAIQLTITFPIAEIVELTADWAFARTNSVGTSLDHASGVSSPWAGQELFVFQRDAAGVWKIARYCFSPTAAPGQ